VTPRQGPPPPGAEPAGEPAPKTSSKAASAEALHTPLSRRLVLGALGVGALALALGNPMLLVLAATMVVFLHAARAGWPGQGEVRLALDATRVQRGRMLPVRAAAATSPAPCAYLLHVALPGSFTVEHGSNVALLEPGGQRLQAFAAGCPKRGPFEVGPATLAAVHPHLLAPSTVLSIAPAQEVLVEPRLLPLRRAQQLRARGRFHLGEDRGVRGLGSTEFREVRTYQRGDPLRAVNWKATAKRSVADLELQVNAFEPDARKKVWFFLDLAEGMEVGTSLDNALEDGVESALALSHHFLTRGHRVGGATFNAPPMVWYPEAGTRQQLAIARGLARAQVGHAYEGLPAAVERVRGFLVRERPTVFVITRPELDPDGLLAGVRRIQTYAGGTAAQPVFVLAPQPEVASSAEAIALAFEALETRSALGGSPGLRVLALRNGVPGLEAALAKGVLTR